MFWHYFFAFLGVVGSVASSVQFYIHLCCMATLQYFAVAVYLCTAELIYLYLCRGLSTANSSHVFCGAVVVVCIPMCCGSVNALMTVACFDHSVCNQVVHFTLHTQHRSSYIYFLIRKEIKHYSLST